MQQKEINELLKDASYEYRKSKVKKTDATVKMTSYLRKTFKEFYYANKKEIYEKEKIIAIGLDVRNVVRREAHNRDCLCLITLCYDDNNNYSFFVIANIDDNKKIKFSGIKFDDKTDKYTFNSSSVDVSVVKDAEQEAMFSVFAKNKDKISPIALNKLKAVA